MADSNNVDLNAAREKRDAARNETGDKTEAPTITIGEKTFTLPKEMPFAVVAAVGDMAAAASSGDGLQQAMSAATIVRALLGDHYEDFTKENPSVEDVMVLLEEVSPKYGLSLGESPASGS